MQGNIAAIRFLTVIFRKKPAKNPSKSRDSVVQSVVRNQISTLGRIMLHLVKITAVARGTNLFCNDLDLASHNNQGDCLVIARCICFAMKTSV